MRHYPKYHRGRKIDPSRERHGKRDRVTDRKYRVNKLQSGCKDVSPRIPPELDVCSPNFDPAKALACRNLPLPYPNAKTYNNISEYYSRTFLKGKDGKNPDSKSAKSQVFVLKRNYDWFYSTIGLSHYEGERIRKMINWRKKQKRVNFGKCKVDKLKNAVEISAESLEPMKSEKVIVKDTSGESYLYLLKNGSAKRVTGKFRNTSASSIGLRLNGDYPTRPRKKSVYYYSPNIRRVLLHLKYREHIHTLYSLRQKAKAAWLQKSNAKDVLNDIETPSANAETVVESSEPDELPNLHSPSDSGIISNYYSSEDTDEACDDDVVLSTEKPADVVEKCGTEHGNQHAVLDKETLQQIENVSATKESGTAVESSKLHLEEHSGETEKFSVQNFQDCIQTRHNLEDKVLHKKIGPDHCNKEVDLVCANKTDDSVLIQKENKDTQGKESLEQMLLRKAREAREMNRQRNQKNPKPKEAEQKSELVNDNQKALSLENHLKKFCEIGSISCTNSEPNVNASLKLPKYDLKSNKFGKSTSMESSVKPRPLVADLTPKNIDCASKLPLRELSVDTLQSKNSGTSLIKQGKKDVPNVASNPVQVSINLKMVSVCDPKQANGANPILKDPSAPSTAVIGLNLDWKGFKIPKKKKKPHSFETADRPSKRSKKSAVRGITRVIRH